MHTIDNEKFGQLLVTLRTEKGMTQKQLATQLFISDKAISKWERGLSFPDISLLLPLCEILNISTTELLSGTRFTEDTTISLTHSNQLLEKIITMKEKHFQLKDLLYQKERITISICRIIIFIAISFAMNLLLVAFLYGVLHQQITWLALEKIGPIAITSANLLIIYNLLSLLLFIYFSFKRSICYFFSSFTYIISGSFLLWLMDFLRRMDHPDTGLLKIQHATAFYVVVFLLNIGMIIYGFLRYKKYREK